MLIVFSVVGLWLSTLAGYRGADDVRAFIMLAFLITSGVAALSHTARRRAFWLGFFGTMLALAMKGFLTNYGANFQWSQRLSSDWAQRLNGNPVGRGQLVMSINMTIIFTVTLVAAVLIGLLCVYVHDQARKQ